MHRALAWKLLLGYLPQQRSEWDGHLRSKRQAYAELRDEVTARNLLGTFEEPSRPTQSCATR